MVRERHLQRGLPQSGPGVGEYCLISILTGKGQPGMECNESLHATHATMVQCTMYNSVIQSRLEFINKLITEAPRAKEVFCMVCHSFIHSIVHSFILWTVRIAAHLWCIDQYWHACMDFILCIQKNYIDRYTVEPLYNGHHWGMRFWPL